tara:strand:+ start:12447 stop:12797 length:351 start_codon:yes stop_codon:yes gene_type:complete
MMQRDRMMQPPKKIKIGYKYFDVRFVERIGMEGQLGAAHWERGEILLLDGGSHVGPTELANTLLHEVIHLVQRFMALNHVREPSEEMITVSLTDGLLMVFADNPKLLLWIQEQMHG